MQLAKPSAVAILLLAGVRLPAGALFKVGTAQRAFVPEEPYCWRGAKTHALVTTIWYPADPRSVEEPQWVGSPNAPLFTVGFAAPDARPASGRFPLIVLSHGTGGSALMLGWLGTALASHGYIFLTAYRRSKLCNILFSYELARRVARTRITVNCVSPGPTATRLGDNMTGLPGLVARVLRNIRFVYPEGGALPLVHAASSTQLDAVTGRFLQDFHDRRTKSITYDVDVARCLWHLSEALCGLL